LRFACRAVDEGGCFVEEVAPLRGAQILLKLNTARTASKAWFELNFAVENGGS
jgi:hypothetical protein